MNNIASELSTNRTELAEQITASVELLPGIGRALHCALNDVAQEFGLTPTQAKVVIVIGAGNTLTVGEIAAKLHISMPAASEIVDRLVDAGHLVRMTDPADRRRVLVAATPESRKMSTYFLDLRRVQIRHALEHLPPEDRPVFVRALAALLSGLQAVGSAAAQRQPGETCHAHGNEASSDIAAATAATTAAPLLLESTFRKDHHE